MMNPRSRSVSGRGSRNDIVNSRHREVCWGIEYVGWVVDYNLQAVKLKRASLLHCFVAGLFEAGFVCIPTLLQDRDR